jgi:hypothetical protein
MIGFPEKPSSVLEQIHGSQALSVDDGAKESCRRGVGRDAGRDDHASAAIGPARLVNLQPGDMLPTPSGTLPSGVAFSGVTLPAMHQP